MCGYLLLYTHCSSISLLLSHFATTKEGFLTQLSFLLFWLLVGDAIWRAATRDGQGLGANDPHNNNPRCIYYMWVFADMRVCCNVPTLQVCVYTLISVLL